jgi:hypothetical protein
LAVWVRGETMPTKTELERRSDIALAALCGEVAGSSSVNSATVEEARGLRQEWVLLQRRPSPSLEEQREIEAKKESLRNRMIDFLARIKWPSDVKWHSD